MRRNCALRSMLLLTAFVIPFVLTASIPAISAETTLKLAPQADLKVIDPVWSSANITLNHGYLVFDTLFALNSKYEPQPQMVERYTVSDDGLSYSFTLRPGLKWHDGTAVTAVDCLQSLKRWGAKDDVGRIAMELTSELAATDARTIVWKLKEPFGMLIPSLAKISTYPAVMMPEALAKTDPQTQIDSANGSGPYKFRKDQWVPGSKVVYEKNTDYVPRSEPNDMFAGAKQAKVDRIEWIYIPDPATAVAALNAGEIDFLESPSVDLLPLLQRNPDVVVRVNDPLGIMVVMRPNHLFPPFNSVKGRQALLYSIDQTEYMTAIGGAPEFWKTCDSMIYCGTSSYSNTGSIKLGGKADLAKAKQLIAESGYKGELVAILQPTDRPAYSATALVLQQNLKKIGVNAELQPMDWSTMTQRRASKNEPAKGGWNIIISGWEGANITPLTYAAINTSCEKAWFGWPCNAEIERLRVAWSREADATKRKAVLDQLHALLVEEAPIAPVGQRLVPMAWRKNVDGVVKAPVLVLWNISKN